MKYFSQIITKDGKKYSLESMEEYTPSGEEIQDFSEVLEDEKVFEYITREAIEKWEHKNAETLAWDILINSRVRWEEGKELRFLLRDDLQKVIGMIGVTLESSTKGELWYYKTAKSSSCMFEALQKALSFLAKEGVTHLFASYELSNVRSAEILLKLGFKEIKTGNVSLELSSLT